MPLPNFVAGLTIAAGALTLGGAMGSMAALDSELAVAAAPAAPEVRFQSVAHPAGVRSVRDEDCARPDGDVASTPTTRS